MKQTITFRAEAQFAAAPEEVWRVMTDIGVEPVWMQAVRDVAFVGAADGYAVGARMRRAGAFLGFRLAWESEIVACERPTLVAYRHVSGSLRGESRWEIAPVGDGAQVSLSSTGPVPGPFRLFPGLAAAAGRTGLRKDLARLKRLVEG